MTDAVGAAQEYFRCVGARDATGLRTVFAPGSAWHWYGGLHLYGAEAIARWYEDTVFRGPTAPAPVTGTPIAQGERCAIEIDIDVGAERLRLIDVFTVDDAGRITDLSIYLGAPGTGGS